MEPYSYALRHGPDGRITQKTETVAGRVSTWKYDYDSAGRLTEAYLDGRMICQCSYDRQGRRQQDYFPASHGMNVRNYGYTMDDRLQSVGNNGYTHDKTTGARSIWNNQGRYTTYQYAPDGRLLRAEQEDAGRVFEFAHDAEGRREAKYENGQMIEAYAWLDLVRLAGFHDGEHGFRFLYEDDETRTPYAMQREDSVVAYLYFDQVGSLRVVADMQGDVIKETLYDPFGGIIEDTNPALRIPIGFAGGLHDRDLGFVRFGWRDYDTFTSRWTAPDPMGDAGGDPDWYGYCLDDPVNGVDPLGLMGSKPGEPDGTEEGALYPSGDGQWQASPGACEKCQALDGKYYKPGSEPERPHPNCKCEVVECYYGSDFTGWKKYEESDPIYDFTDPMVFALNLLVTPIWWTKTVRVKEMRSRTSFKLCGERKDVIKTITELRVRRVVEEKRTTARRDAHTPEFTTNNPWVVGDTRYGKVEQTH